MLEKYKFKRSRGKSGTYGKLSFTLFNDLAEKVKHLADEQQVSRSSVINRALEEYFKGYPGDIIEEE